MKTGSNNYKGLNTDIGYDSIKDFYIDALDIRITTDKGESMGSITNIKGNTFYFQLPTSDPDLTVQGGLEIIGATSIRQEIIIFLTDDSDANGWIYSFTYDDVDKSFLGLNLVYKDSELNFSKDRPIEAVGRFENSKIKRVYFTDYNNYLRSINIEDPDLLNTPVGLLDIFPDITYTLPILNKVLTGGSIKSGLWQYAYRLITFDGKESLISPPSNLIHTTDSLESNTQSAQYTGDVPSVDTNKSHEILIDTSEYTDFEKIELIGIYHENSITTAQVFSIETKDIGNQSSIIFTHTGNENTIVALDEATYIRKQYPFKTVKSLTAKDNSLVAANIKEGAFSIQDLLESGETFDAKTKRYLDDGTTLPNPDTTEENKLLNAFNQDYNKDAHWDVDWHKNSQYKYKSDGATLGGDGPNVSYKFNLEPFVIDGDAQPGFANISNNPITTVNLNDGYNYNNTTYDSNASPFNSGLLRQYKRGEVYRVGIVFYNKKGETSFVEYIGDIKFPDISEETLEDTTGEGQNYFPLSLETSRNTPNSITTTAYALGLEFTLDFSSCPSLPNKIKGFQIVRVKRSDGDTKRVCSGIMKTTMYQPIGPDPADHFDLRSPDEDENILHLFPYQQERSGSPSSPEEIGYGANSNFYTLSSKGVTGSGLQDTLNRIEGGFISFYSPEISYNFKNSISTILDESYLLMTGRYGQYYSIADNIGNMQDNITNNTAKDKYSFDALLQIDTSATEALNSSAGNVYDYRRKMRSTGKVDKKGTFPPGIPLVGDSVGYEEYEKGIEYIKKWRDVAEIRFDSNSQTDSTDEEPNNDLASNLTKALGPYKGYNHSGIEKDYYIRNFHAQLEYIGASNELNNAKASNATFCKGASGVTGSLENVNQDPLDPSNTLAKTVPEENPWFRSSDFYEVGSERLISSDPDSSGVLSGTVKAQDLISTPILDIMIPRSEIYGGFTADALENNIFQPASPVINIDIISGNSHTFKVYGGDTFISMWTFQSMAVCLDRRFFNETGASSKEFHNNFSEVMAMPIETKVNTEIDYGATYRRGVKYNAQGSSGGVERSVFRQETDNSEMGFAKSKNMYKYNEAYSIESDELASVVKPKNLDSSIGITNDIRAYISNVKINGEVIDSWTQFGINNFYDVDDYGPINKILNFKDKVFFIQDRAIGNYSINPRAVVSATDGIPTELGTGEGFKDHIYVSNSHGSIHQWAVKSTNYGIYFWDSLHSKIFKIGGQGSQAITEVAGIHSLVNSLDGDCRLRKENGGDNPILNRGVIISRDNINDEVLFTFLGAFKKESDNITLVYDELTNTFSSKYSATPPVYIENGDILLSVDNSNRQNIYRHNSGNWGEFYGNIKESKISLVLNADSPVNKILRYIEFNSIVRDDNKSIDRTQTITAFKVETEYQTTNKVPFSADRVKRKFDKWRLKIPRDQDTGNNKHRLRGTYFILTLYFDNSYNKELILNRILYHYDIQMF